MPKQNPFEDLFGEREEERRGPLVSREVLDPNYSYKPELARDLLSSYLCNIDYEKNPFLFSPSDLIQDGFKGTPYNL